MITKRQSGRGGSVCQKMAYQVERSVEIEQTGSSTMPQQCAERYECTVSTEAEEHARYHPCQLKGKAAVSTRSLNLDKA